ncbi:hypothetical protein OYB53_11430 [Escherichia coli]|nr:hypothetical protein [Escherichia coli]
MGLNVASVKSYVSSALTTTLFGSGVGEREVGKLTSIIMNKMLFTYRKLKNQTIPLSTPYAT